MTQPLYVQTSDFLAVTVTTHDLVAKVEHDQLLRLASD